MTDEKRSTQKQVFDAVSTERRYQDLLPKARTEGKDSVADFLLRIAEDADRARAAYLDSDGDVAARDNVRKIAAHAVHCLEIHGVIERVW